MSLYIFFIFISFRKIVKMLLRNYLFVKFNNNKKNYKQKLNHFQIHCIQTFFCLRNKRAFLSILCFVWFDPKVFFYRF